MCLRKFRKDNGEVRFGLKLQLVKNKAGEGFLQITLILFASVRISDCEELL